MKFLGALLVLTLCLAPAAAQTVLKTEFQDTQPKFILGADGKFTGLMLELMAIVEKSSDFQFSYPALYVPIQRITTDLGAGAIDAYWGLAKTPQREKDFVYVAKLFSTRYQLVARKDDPAAQMTSIDQVIAAQIPVMVIRGGAPENYYKSISGLTLTQAPNGLEASMLQVKAGNARLFGYYDLGNNWLLDTLKFHDSLTALPIVLASDDQWFCVSRSLPDSVVERLTKTMVAAQKTKEWAAVIKKYFPTN